MNSISLVSVFSSGCGGGGRDTGGVEAPRNEFLADRHPSMLARLGRRVVTDSRSRTAAGRAPLKRVSLGPFASELRPVSDCGARRDHLPSICHGDGDRVTRQTAMSLSIVAERKRSGLGELATDCRVGPLENVSLRFLTRVKEDTDGTNGVSVGALGVCPFERSRGPDRPVEKREHALMASSSNALSNVVTIDEIGGATSGLPHRPTHHQSQQQQRYRAQADVSAVPQIQQHMQLPSSEDVLGGLVTRGDSRVSMLRDYMRVYVNWRTSRLVQEYRDLIGGAVRRPCAMTTAIPARRLEQFQQALQDRRSSTVHRDDCLTTDGSHGDTVGNRGETPRLDEEANMDDTALEQDDTSTDEGRTGGSSRDM